MPDGAGQELVRSLKPEVPSGHLRNPFTRLAEHVSRGEALHIPALKEKDEVRLALVSLPSPISLPPTKAEVRHLSIADACRFPTIDRRSCLRSLAWPHRTENLALRESYSSGVRHALEELNADIVCVNELGFPSYRAKPLKKIERFTRTLAKRHRAFVLAGSAHDERTLYNTAHLFFPDCPEEGIAYHKQVSAVSMGELVSTPPARSTVLSYAFGLWIGVLICLDLADFSSVTAVVKFTEHCDLLLVPCFTEWTEELERIAHATSRAMPGIVALVNFHGNNHKPACILSRFGESIPADCITGIPGSEGSICLFSFPPAEFKNAKIQRWIGASSEDRMEWLFGNRTQPLVKRS